MTNFKTKEILSLPVADITLSEILPIISSLINSRGIKTIYYANPHTFNLYFLDSEFKKALMNADLIFPEGTGTVFISKLFGKSLKGKTPFLDFMDSLFQLAQNKGWKIYILGGTKVVNSAAVKNLSKQYPSLKIIGSHHGYFNLVEEAEIIQTIELKKPNILFVAMSPPIQEKWIHNNQNKINAGAAIAIGGAIDILAGKYARAPQWMQKIGLEWLFRVYQEPARLGKKYLIGNMLFFLVALLLSLKSRNKN